jgi:small subunit ribosomal protein S21
MHNSNREAACIASGGATLNQIGEPVQVLVRDNNVDQALRVLKKKMQREGVFREMRQRRAYEKPSERRTREKAEAIRRARKLARKQAQREGLLPTPKRKESPAKHRPAELAAAPRAS